MSDAQAWLGKLLPNEVGRDATHLAVVPMIAATEMEPGSHCGVIAPSEAGLVSEEKCIGIVDPFLRETVKAGERFYLCLYPRSVSGERHAHVNLDPVEELLRRRGLWASAPGEDGQSLAPAAAIVPLHTIERALAELISNRVENNVAGARAQLERFTDS